jgi:hypothetical protein
MSIKVMRQARNAFVWNLNTDLDNIPACDQWAKMLRKNIDALDQAIAEAEKREWVGLTDEELDDCVGLDNGFDTYKAIRNAEAKLKQKNGC